MRLLFFNKMNRFSCAYKHKAHHTNLPSNLTLSNVRLFHHHHHHHHHIQKLTKCSRFLCANTLSCIHSYNSCFAMLVSSLFPNKFMTSFSFNWRKDECLMLNIPSTWRATTRTHTHTEKRVVFRLGTC